MPKVETNDHFSIRRLAGGPKVLSSVAEKFVRFWPGFVLAIGLMAMVDDLAPIGIVRGVLIGCDATHLTIGDEDNRAFKFVTDGRTFIERDHQRVSCANLRTGDRMEVVSDRSNEAGSRYARMASVVNGDTRPRRRNLIVARAPIVQESPTARFAPRGSIIFTGVVLRLESTGLVLRTRLDGEKWILVRRDTLFRDEGLQVESTSLPSGARVFVRAGRNLDGEVEAYEVDWGEILSPSGLR